MAVFPRYFDRFIGKAVQELSEKVHRFDPDFLMAVLKSGRLVGLSVQYYLKEMYGEEVPLDYVHSTTVREFGRTTTTTILNEKDLKEKEEMIRGRRIALLDDYSKGMRIKKGTIRKTVSYIREHLGPSAVRGFCLYNNTFLRRLGEEVWDKQYPGDLTSIGWHEFLSKNSGMIYDASAIVKSSKLKYMTAQKKLKRIEEVETRIKELIEAVVMESKNKP